MKHQVLQAVQLGFTPTTRLVLLYLEAHQGRSPYFDTTVGEVADAVGAKRNTVAKGLRELEDQGWLTRERLRDEDHGGDIGIRVRTYDPTVRAAG